MHNDEGPLEIAANRLSSGPVRREIPGLVQMQAEHRAVKAGARQCATCHRTATAVCGAPWNFVPACAVCAEGYRQDVQLERLKEWRQTMRRRTGQ